MSSEIFFEFQGKLLPPQTKAFLPFLADSLQRPFVSLPLDSGFQTQPLSLRNTQKTFSAAGFDTLWENLSVPRKRRRCLLYATIGWLSANKKWSPRVTYALALLPILNEPQGSPEHSCCYGLVLQVLCWCFEDCFLSYFAGHNLHLFLPELVDGQLTRVWRNQQVFVCNHECKSFSAFSLSWFAKTNN